MATGRPQGQASGDARGPEARARAINQGTLETASDVVVRFAQALKHLENTGDTGPIVSCFCGHARLTSPVLSQPASGREGIRQYWESYRAGFKTVRSEFRAVIEQGDSAAMEWSSEGSLRGHGQFVRYSGTNVLRLGEGCIREFHTYFDQTPLLNATQAASGEPGEGEPGAY